MCRRMPLPRRPRMNWPSRLTTGSPDSIAWITVLKPEKPSVSSMRCARRIMPKKRARSSGDEEVRPLLKLAPPLPIAALEPLLEERADFRIRGAEEHQPARRGAARDLDPHLVLKRRILEGSPGTQEQRDVLRQSKRAKVGRDDHRRQRLVAHPEVRQRDQALGVMRIRI